MNLFNKFCFYILLSLSLGDAYSLFSMESTIDDDNDVIINTNVEEKLSDFIPVENISFNNPKEEKKIIDWITDWWGYVRRFHRRSRSIIISDSFHQGVQRKCANEGHKLSDIINIEKVSFDNPAEEEKIFNRFRALGYSLESGSDEEPTSNVAVSQKLALSVISNDRIFQSVDNKANGKIDLLQDKFNNSLQSLSNTILPDNITNRAAQAIGYINNCKSMILSTAIVSACILSYLGYKSYANNNLKDKHEPNLISATDYFDFLMSLDEDQFNQYPELYNIIYNSGDSSPFIFIKNARAFNVLNKKQKDQIIGICSLK